MGSLDVIVQSRATVRHRDRATLLRAHGAAGAAAGSGQRRALPGGRHVAGSVGLAPELRPKDGDDGSDGGDFRGPSRSNDTHASTTDPDARLVRKGKGKEAKLSCRVNALMENRNGLPVGIDVRHAAGTGETRWCAGVGRCPPEPRRDLGRLTKATTRTTSSLRSSAAASIRASHATRRAGAARSTGAARAAPAMR